MTQRQAKLIDDRAYLIKQVYKYHDIDSDKVEEKLAKYSVMMPCGIILRLAYMPDAIIETVVAELESEIGEVNDGEN